MSCKKVRRYCYKCFKFCKKLVTDKRFVTRPTIFVSSLIHTIQRRKNLVRKTTPYYKEELQGRRERYGEVVNKLRGSKEQNGVTKGTVVTVERLGRRCNDKGFISLPVHGQGDFLEVTEGYRITYFNMESFL